LVDASSESVESIAKGTWARSPEDPAQDARQLYGIRRYGASKLCGVMMIPELQRRLASDPNLNKISVLGVDPGMMPTNMVIATLPWIIRVIFSLVARVTNFFSPNGMLRLPRKSAGDVLAAALGIAYPTGERPKGLYLNGNEPKEIGIEAKSPEKRAAVWKASVQYAELREGETCLVDWQ
jgi:NAD(P)-dependent dehydrogenase (short-subunit alcohol dehydrogenase family)